MSLALSLFPDADGLDELIEASMPAFSLLLCIVALGLILTIANQAIQQWRCRSPVDQLLRRRVG